MRFPFPIRRLARPRASTPPPAAPPVTEEALLARLEADQSLRGSLDDVAWEPIHAWLRQAVHAVFADSAVPSDSDSRQRAFMAIYDSALLLGDVLLAGPDQPDFAGSLEALEAYLAPYFPVQTSRAFPKLIEDAQRLHENEATSDEAAVLLGEDLLRAFSETS